MKDILFTLYQKPQTVFSSSELSLIFPGIRENNLRRRLSYFAAIRKLRRLRHGLYAKIDFNPLEVAGKIYSPSYISRETILKKHGMIFQESETISAVSYLTRKIEMPEFNIKISYRKLKDEVLCNRFGLVEQNGWFEAGAERAFLDAVFLYKNYHFDNLGMLDWNKINELKNIYKSQALEKRIKEYYKIKKENE